MGSAGLEWDSNDQPSQARLNQKTTFVGTGAQISGLSTTYAGQIAFCTSTGSGFTADEVYVRDSTNSSWSLLHVVTDNITEQSEENTTPVTDGAEFNPTAATRYYSHFTLPTTYPVYHITGIEWKNGTAVAGNVTCGIDAINADPPTVDSTPLMALGSNIAQSGTSAVQRNSQIASNLIRGGTVCGAWVAFSSASATVRRLTSSDSQKRTKTTSSSDNETPNASNVTVFNTATTNEVYLKVYYVGYN